MSHFASKDRIALDRASVRSTDANGHMHVADSVISSAVVNDYMGAEVADWQSLGLDPNKVYRLLRDPKELEAGVPSFHGKPLLSTHKAHFADDHDKEIQVGTVMNPRWDDPDVRAELEIWDADVIRAIESGEASALSCGYHYTPVMEPGVHDGKSYDGRMTAIFGNHVAIVSEPRVRHAMVGDAKPNQFLNPGAFHMKLSNTATAVRGALTAYLRPKLAADAKLDLAAVLRDVTKTTWAADKAALPAKLKAATQGKLAKDADLEDVIDVLEQLDDVVDEIVEAKTDDPETTDDDTDDLSKVMAALADLGLSDETLAKIRAAVGTTAAASDEKDDDKKQVAKDSVSMKTFNATVVALRGAMDAKASAAIEAAQSSTMARIKGVHDAEKEVFPLVGQVSGMDSGEAVYRYALEREGADLTGVTGGGFRAMVAMLNKSKGKIAADSVVAFDRSAAATDDLAKRFPGVRALKIR